jgi:hypothetical protein
MASVIRLFVSYVGSAMSHLDRGVRATSVAFLQLLVRYFPSLMWQFHVEVDIFTSTHPSDPMAWCPCDMIDVMLAIVIPQFCVDSIRSHECIVNGCITFNINDYYYRLGYTC